MRKFLPLLAFLFVATPALADDKKNSYERA